MKIIVYSSMTEIIIMTTENEEEATKFYFENTGRDIEDFDRQDITPQDTLHIESRTSYATFRTMQEA